MAKFEKEKEELDPYQDVIQIERVILPTTEERNRRQDQQKRSAPLTVGAMEDLFDDFRTKLAVDIEASMVRALTKVFGKQQR